MHSNEIGKKMGRRKVGRPRYRCMVGELEDIRSLWINNWLLGTKKSEGTS
jgi:hypothetical protein